MALFIRNQLSPYCIESMRLVAYQGEEFFVDAIVPAMHLPAPIPHGRNAYTFSPGDWGPDKFGYTDFDDYHLALYGA